MPRPATNQRQVDQPKITLRLKHGIHTIFLFVMQDWTFDKITSELLDILRDRYPDGLTTSIAPPKTTPVPAADSPEADNVRIVYGLPYDMDDLAQGWKTLAANGDDTVFEKRLADQSALAFSLVPADEDVDEEDVAFEVEVPTLD